MLAAIYKKDELNRVNAKIAANKNHERMQSEQIYVKGKLETPSADPTAETSQDFFQEEQPDEATESMPGQTTGADSQPSGQRELDSDEFEDEMNEESPGY